MRPTQNKGCGGKMRKFGKVLVVIAMFFCLITITNVRFNEIYSLPENFLTNYSEIKELNQNKKFGSIVNGSIESGVKNTATGEKEDIIVFKIFGFIPIRKVKVSLSTDDELFIGGVPIGISIQTNGVVVSEDNEYFKEGDIIREINNEPVKSQRDFNNIEEAEINYLRQNKERKVIIKNLSELKMAATNNVSGVGTLTYVNPNTNEFGSLGHAVTENKSIIEVEKGKVYSCNLLGIEKGKRNEPGQLRCIFLQNSGSKGDICLNNKYGVFGTINDRSNLIDENRKAKIGGRLSVTPGKAKIVSNISGISEEYDIEIIKANYQSNADDKSIVIRVTDKKLLELTGGIVQGMSGSPILQNGRIVGAVTHVFTSDPTKGYGVYIDWMLQNNIKDA